MGLHVITGPPAAGKTTLAYQLAKHGDVVVDFDRLANALTVADPDNHEHPSVVRTVARAARQTAIEVALRHTDTVDVYVIHTEPSDDQLTWYRQMGAQVRVVDPGQDVVLARCRRDRPPGMAEVARRWYRTRSATTSTKITHSSRAW